jgi:hypothetical protein
VEVLRLKPEAAGAEYHLAVALARQDKLKEAILHAQQALELAKAVGQTGMVAKAEAFLRQPP